MNIQELEDRMALKELVDLISIFADKKDVQSQVQLFTEHALSETIIGDTSILKLKGREEMKHAFTGFLKDFDTVYHINGQQKVTINGDNAVGTSYCTATLIGSENGKKMKTTVGITYQDDFIRENNCWLIAKRIGIFEWQEKSEINT